MHLARLLVDNQTLKLLDVSSNNLKSKGVKLLASALQSAKINTLIVNDNGMCSEGALSLHLARSVTELHLKDNLVSSVGLQAVLKLKLVVLNIQGNSIGVELLHGLNQALK